jgi:hypothetical protein
VTGCKVVVVQLATDCPLGPEVACKCRPASSSSSEDAQPSSAPPLPGQQECVVSSSSLRGAVTLPPKVTAVFPKDVTLERGTRIVMALSSRLLAQQSLRIEEDVALQVRKRQIVHCDKSKTYSLVFQVSDPRRRVPVGAHGIVEAASMTGAFASVSMDRSMQLSRLFYCFQFPKLRVVATGTSLTAHFSTLGQYCISPMLTMPLLFAALGALLYGTLFGFCGSRAEKLEYKRR